LAATREEVRMKKPIYVLNGPNLNLLGQRQPEVYGRETLADVVAKCEALARDLGVEVRCLQSNHEGQLVDWVQEARVAAAGVIINAGAYTHTSVAILDALNAFEGPVIEVHISNIHKREAFRHHSYISGRADGVIVGCGTEGYLLALRRVVSLSVG
jgi:3-dehydroquinate dehydratase-2